MNRACACVRRCNKLSGGNLVTELRHLDVKICDWNEKAELEQGDVAPAQLYARALSESTNARGESRLRLHTITYVGSFRLIQRWFANLL